MMPCVNDALVNLLNSKGYHPVFLPLSGLEPPEIYTYVPDTELVRRGPLADYLPRNTKLPSLTSGALSSIVHKQTSHKNVSAAVSFLKDALACIGITSAPRLDLSFASGKELTFSFVDATYRAVDPTKLDHLLDGLNTGAVPAHYVAEGRLHIIYDYAYATTIKMQSSDEQAFKYDVSGANIESFIDLGTKGQVKSQSTSAITFKGATNRPAAFAFKAGQLKLNREGKKWEFYPGEVMREGHAFIGDEGEGIPYLMEQGVVMRLSDSQ